MRKLLVVLLLCFSIFTHAQNKIIQVEGKSPDLYITHIVAPKESYYSIGRLYNQAPKTIATFNSLQFEKGLNIGQVIKVPATTQNFDINGNAAADEALVPVHHIVAKSETLFRIGNNHGASPDAIKKWNSLPSDNIEVGTPLIVGYLKIKKDQLAALNTQAAPTVTATAPATSTTPVNNPAPEVKKDAATFESLSPKPAPQKQAEPVVKTVPAADTSSNKPEALPITKEVSNVETKPVIEVKKPAEEKKTEPIKTAKPAIIDLSTAGGELPGEGVFAGNFSNNQDRNLVNKNGEAGTFKSTSGWQDKKYYALMNEVPVGTIVKITAGEKVIYAKVLDAMPAMKENNGLLVRLSNSAASFLGIIDPKFPVQVSYYQ